MAESSFLDGFSENQQGSVLNRRVSTMAMLLSFINWQRQRRTDSAGFRATDAEPRPGFQISGATQRLGKRGRGFYVGGRSRGAATSP